MIGGTDGILDVNFGWVKFAFQRHTHWGVAIGMGYPYRVRFEFVSNRLGDYCHDFSRSAK